MDEEITNPPEDSRLSTAGTPTPAVPSRAVVWTVGIASAVGLFLAFPPCGWWLLAWLAPAGWIWLCTVPVSSPRRFFGMLYVCGCTHWLLVIHWIRLPHFSAYFGWIVLSAYLGIYVPLFVFTVRRLVNRWRCPLWLAAPVAWGGWELARGYLFTGFSMALLGHTLWRQPIWIQGAAWAGAYGVGMAMVLAIGIVVQSLSAAQGASRRVRVVGVLAAASVVLGMGLFGAQMMPSPDAADPDKCINVALIQGSRDTTFSEADDPRETLRHYREWTRAVLEKEPQVDLIVWPESVHTVPWIDSMGEVRPPAEFEGSEAEYQEWAQMSADIAAWEAAWFARQFGVPALVGCAALEIDGGELRRYNRALWLDAQGSVAGAYDKMHPVMFGEYVPLGNVFPFLYRLTPMGNGLTSGVGPLAVRVKNVTLSPSICYENTVPHLIRRQARMLADAGEPPDVLVTLSNDGWFWGSSELDLHLACGVFRAVELRRPVLIAANTGFSAWIDARGVIRQEGPRRETGYVMARVGPACAASPQAIPKTPTRKERSWYWRWGDAVPSVALLISLVAMVPRFGSSGPRSAAGEQR